MTAILACPVLAGCGGHEKLDTETVAVAAVQSVSPAEVQATEYRQMLGELRRASECVSTAEARPEFAPLRAKAPSSPGGADAMYPAAMMDKSKATPAQGKLIGTFLELIAPCRPDFPAVTVREHRNITRMISDTWMQQQELYTHLKGGQITWGVFNQGTRVNADKLSGGLLALRLTNEG
ncbi:MAG: hypothetical protein WCF85_08160 [Rhodospirillaceae bacterium]